MFYNPIIHIHFPAEFIYSSIYFQFSFKVSLKQLLVITSLLVVDFGLNEVRQ